MLKNGGSAATPPRADAPQPVPNPRLPAAQANEIPERALLLSEISELKDRLLATGDKLITTMEENRLLREVIAQYSRDTNEGGLFSQQPPGGGRDAPTAAAGCPPLPGPGMK